MNNYVDAELPVGHGVVQVSVLEILLIPICKVQRSHFLFATLNDRWF